MDFSTTLLREKFVIGDSRAGEPEDTITALSNRMVLSLYTPQGMVSEEFVIRSQMMHTCIRMASKIAQTYQKFGPLMARDEKFDFQQAWEDIVYDHERQFNPKCWAAVYHKGKKIFRTNEYHAFLDVIENCDVKNASRDYNTSIGLAEDIFTSRGKDVDISYDANTGMILDIRGAKARCGMILRSPVRRNNFNYTAEEIPGGAPMNVTQSLVASAALLESINLAFLIGRTNEWLRLGVIPKHSPDDNLAMSARKRLARLEAEISGFESSYKIRYRPEKPESRQIMTEAEKFTQRQWEIAQAEKELAENAEGDYAHGATL